MALGDGTPQADPTSSEAPAPPGQPPIPQIQPGDPPNLDPNNNFQQPQQQVLLPNQPQHPQVVQHYPQNVVQDAIYFPPNQPNVAQYLPQQQQHVPVHLPPPPMGPPQMNPMPALPSAYNPYLTLTNRQTQENQEMQQRHREELRQSGIPMPPITSTPIPGAHAPPHFSTVAPPGTQYVPARYPNANVTPQYAQESRTHSTGPGSRGHVTAAQMAQRGAPRGGPRPASLPRTASTSSIRGPPAAGLRQAGFSQAAAHDLNRPPRVSAPQRKGVILEMCSPEMAAAARQKRNVSNPNKSFQSTSSASAEKSYLSVEEAAKQVVNSDEDDAAHQQQIQAELEYKEEMRAAQARIRELQNEVDGADQRAIARFRKAETEIREEERKKREAAVKEAEDHVRQQFKDAAMSIDRSGDTPASRQHAKTNAELRQRIRNPPQVTPAAMDNDPNTSVAETTEGQNRGRDPQDASTSQNPASGAEASRAAPRGHSPIMAPSPAPVPTYTTPPMGDAPSARTDSHNPYQGPASVVQIEAFVEHRNVTPHRRKKRRERSPSPATRAVQQAEDQEYQLSKDRPIVVGTHNARAVQGVPASQSTLPQWSFEQPPVIFNPVHVDPTLGEDLPQQDGSNATDRDLQSGRWWFYQGPEYYGPEAESGLSHRLARAFVRRVKRDLGIYVNNYTPQMFFDTLYAFENVYRTHYDACTWRPDEIPPYRTASLQFVIRCRQEMQRRLGEGGHLWHFMPRALLRPLNMERIWSQTTSAVFRHYVGFNNAFGPFRYIMDDRLGPAQARNANYNTYRWRQNPVIQTSNRETAEAAMRRSLQIYRDFLEYDFRTVMPDLQEARRRTRNLQPRRIIPIQSVIRDSQPCALDAARQIKDAVDQQWVSALMAMIKYHRDTRVENNHYPSSQAFREGAEIILNNQDINIEDLRPSTGGTSRTGSRQHAQAPQNVQLYYDEDLEADGHGVPRSYDNSSADDEGEAPPPLRRRDRTKSRQRKSRTKSRSPPRDRDDKKKHDDNGNRHTRHSETTDKGRGTTGASETQDQPAGRPRLSDAPVDNNNRRTVARRSRSPRDVPMDALEAMAHQAQAIINEKGGPTIQSRNDRRELSKLRSEVHKDKRSPPQRRDYTHYENDPTGVRRQRGGESSTDARNPWNTEVGGRPVHQYPTHRSPEPRGGRSDRGATSSDAYRGGTSRDDRRGHGRSRNYDPARYHTSSRRGDRDRDPPRQEQVAQETSSQQEAVERFYPRPTDNKDRDDAPPQRKRSKTPPGAQQQKSSRDAHQPERRRTPLRDSDRSRATKTPHRTDDKSTSAKDPPRRHSNEKFHDTREKTPARPQQLMAISVDEPNRNVGRQRSDPRKYRQNDRQPEKRRSPLKRTYKQSSKDPVPPPPKPDAGESDLPRSKLPTVAPPRRDQSAASRHSRDSRAPRHNDQAATSSTIHQHDAKRRKHRRKSQSSSDSDSSSSGSESPLTQKPKRKSPQAGDDPNRRDKGKDTR